jgi:deazaflavin-dependent oxidoreductase (nitroreductase family)
VAANDEIIELFRSKAGVLGGHWEGKTTVLLHVPGRKTGREFVHPLVAAPYGDNAYVLCGSRGGAPTEAQWFANLEAADDLVTVELGADTLKAEHQEFRPGRDEDWEKLYNVFREYWPDAAEYEKKTDRKFPVAVISLR